MITVRSPRARSKRSSVHTHIWATLRRGSHDRWVRCSTRLRKARENLASAEADLSAGRLNSAASRAYYAAFQAAVAALIEQGISPRGESWDHKFVISEFSGKLIRRRKVVSGRLTGTLDVLL